MEKLLATDRNIDYLYPHVDVWGFPISSYLFLGGLAAGILLFAALYYLLGKEKDMPFTVKIGPLFAFPIIVLGLFLLVFDLHHKLYVWQLFMTARAVSPMSWGAWTLVIVSFFSLLWPLSFIDSIDEYLIKRGWSKMTKVTEYLIKLEHKWIIPHFIIIMFRKYRKFLAFVMLIYSIILGIYTGILLSAFNAHPLWNNPILGPLFLTSGVSTGSAFVMWLSNNKKERLLMSAIDMSLIAIELFFIVHMFMGMEAGAEVYKQAAGLFLGGEFTAVFWGVFVGMGLILPFILEALELKGFHIPIVVPAILILVGGLIFRIIMVQAGQMSEYPMFP